MRSANDLICLLFVFFFFHSRAESVTSFRTTDQRAHVRLCKLSKKNLKQVSKRSKKKKNTATDDPLAPPQPTVANVLQPLSENQNLSENEIEARKNQIEK